MIASLLGFLILSVIYAINKKDKIVPYIIGQVNQEMQGEITYYNRQGGIKRIDEEFFAKDSKVVSLAEYRRLKELTSE